MKVSEAEQLVCPFMLYQESALHELFNCKCITTECMAWKITKTHKSTGVYVNGKEVDRKTGKKLDPKDCEGYCIRLQND